MRAGTDVVEAHAVVQRQTAEPAATQAGAEFAARFNSRVRGAVRRFAATSSRSADLAYVFPAAAFVIASRAAPATELERAQRLIEDGAPLREVARALGLPLWLRRLPPEAFRAALGVLPMSEMFSRRIANHFPIPTGESALWLASVSFAARACDEYFALWVAGQRIFMEPHRDPEKLLSVLAAYAWFSTADRTRGHSLIVTPWRPEMAFDTAVCAAKSWFNRVRLVLQLREGVLSDAWLTPGDVSGLTFSPLMSANEILAESRAMQNCADQYSDRLAKDRCRLFSVRRRGVRVATLEIGPHAREPNMLAINQLKARHNLPAASEIWQAAHAWLATQSGLRRTPPLSVPELPLNGAAWTTLMQPYRASKDGARWLTSKPSADAFNLLDSQMADLARRGGVSSWLFTA